MLFSNRFTVIVLLCVVTAVKVKSASVIQVPKAEPNTNWWKNAVIYQIYPRSFLDKKTNDGIGDINGIINKLQYFAETNITAIWLAPIYLTPADNELQVDFGYEITDYKDIDANLGTLKEFTKLVTEAHKLGIKIILEFVPNHSSNKHDWFTKSETRTPGFEDFYVWQGDDTKIPSNWVSHFDEPAWTYSSIRKQWYLHQFAKEQPDLNYASEPVRTEIRGVLQFWLDKGVDGFVIDSAPYLTEDQKFENEEVAEGTEAKEGEYEYLDHKFTSNQDATYNLIAEWREHVDKFNEGKPEEDPRIIITKAYTNIDKTKSYCGEGSRNGAHFTLNPLFLTDLTKDSTATEIINTIDKWITNIPNEKCPANWLLGHHDQQRVATKFGSDRVDGLNILTAFLSGIMITYNGEEIGQENGEVKWADCRDPLACKGPVEEYEKTSRDFMRTPFHWDDSTNAGFTTAKKPWLPVSAAYKTNNLNAQSAYGVISHYQNYQILTALRRNLGFTDATVIKKAYAEDNVIALIKEVEEGQTYVAVINLSNKEQKVDLSEFAGLNKYIKVIAANVASKKHERVLSSTKEIALDAYESFVARALEVQEEGDLDWWKHSVIYQIYPLSFKDNNNDGIGDLKGIISKLSYLSETGVTAAWLSPIYKSPQVDQGYDISDFRDIDERFGTLEDFDEMVRVAHELGIKIVMDFVPNHSSNKHEWFTKSEESEGRYKDYYIWKKGKGLLNSRPNNWLSLFKNPDKNSAWSYSTLRKQYYLHQFADAQPDLNYRSPAVVKEMKDIIKFWLDRGVDGFRMDAVPYLYEHEGFQDESSVCVADPCNCNPNLGETEHSYLKHTFTSDQPETFDMIYQWRELVDDYTKEKGGDARVLMTEAYTDIENTMKYYGEEEENGRKGGHFTFNFQLITRLNRTSNARAILDAVKEWMNFMPDHYTPNWVLGNHDQHRVATRFGTKNIDGFNMLAAILPGVMITYNGEEIGQQNGEISWEEGQDPSACNGSRYDFDKISRDFERTPFHWDATVNAGFNRGAKPWLPVSRMYLQNNLQAQNKPDITSHYNVYKNLLKLRKEPLLTKGTFTIKALTDDVLICTRTLESDSYVFLFNLGEEVETVNVRKGLKTVTPYLRIVSLSTKSYRSVGDLIPSKLLLIDAHESIIAVTTTNVPITTTATPGGGDDRENNGGGAAGITISFVALIVTLFSSVFLN